jgi:hypothetical protein
MIEVYCMQLGKYDNYHHIIQLICTNKRRVAEKKKTLRTHITTKNLLIWQTLYLLARKARAKCIPPEVYFRYLKGK